MFVPVLLNAWVFWVKLEKTGLDLTHSKKTEKDWVITNVRVWIQTRLKKNISSFELSSFEL